MKASTSEAAYLQQQAARRRLTPRSAWLFLALVVAIIALVGYLLLPGEVHPEAPPHPSTAALVPPVVTAQGEVHLGAGGKVLPASAPQRPGSERVDVVMDPLCLGCALTHKALSKDLLQRMTSGEVDGYYHLMVEYDSRSTNGYSTYVANALLEVAEAEPTKFYPFLTELYQEKNMPSTGEGTFVVLEEEKVAAAAQAAAVGKATQERFPARRYGPWLSLHNEWLKSRRDLFPLQFTLPSYFVGGRLEEGALQEQLMVPFTTVDQIKAAFDKTLQASQERHK